MSREAVQLFCALLALVALGGAVLITGARFVRSAGPGLAAVAELRTWLAWLVAAACMAGSLYFSEVAHFPPCEYCWYQRICMYPLAVILLVAALRRDRRIGWYAVPLAGIGALISSYHYLIEWHPNLQADSCDAAVPCTIVWFREFGFISLPFMALCGFLAVIALLTTPSPLEEE